LVSIAAGG